MNFYLINTIQKDSHERHPHKRQTISITIFLADGLSVWGFWYCFLSSCSGFEQRVTTVSDWVKGEDIVQEALNQNGMEIHDDYDRSKSALFLKYEVEFILNVYEVTGMCG